jgi:hypothetical protein
LFLSFVSSWVLYASGQITKQIFWPAPVPATVKTCEEGLASLHNAIEKGRASAELENDPAKGLLRFRAEVDPVWVELPPIQGLCQAAADRRSLDALERLRYAEEHAVRREASSLAALRKQVASDVAARTTQGSTAANQVGGH